MRFYFTLLPQSQILAWLLAIVLLPTSLLGQQYQLSNAIEVQNAQGQPLRYPWAGGFNVTQFSNIDMNLDGVQDLVAFNQDGSSFTVFLHTGGVGQIDYEYAPEYAANFDSCDCIQWALLKDYNCDGLPDIWCGRGVGQNFKLYKQVIYGDSVGFELVMDPILSYTNSPQYLYQERTDIPAIVDVDNDGDIDVVASTSGFNFFLLHRNVAMETLGRCDTLIYERESGCWGGFLESGSGNTIVTKDTIACPRTGGGRDPIDPANRHVGSTLLVEDFNADSLVDVMIGDISYSTAVVSYNAGTMTDAEMDSVEADYPQLDSMIDVEVFPAFFYVDVNNDQVRDLVIGPNTSQGGETVNNIVLYQNLGFDNDVQFTFDNRGFLANEQIDAGVASAPAFFDHNQDGLMDLVIGSRIATEKFQDTVQYYYTIMLFENIGTLDKPIFKLIDDNYLNIQSFSPPLSDVTLAFGDLDGDNDDDLLVGNTAGTIYHFINTANPNQPANFVAASNPKLLDDIGIEIDVTVASAPELYDIDGDDDLDLFIGQRGGTIYFYENIGTQNSPSFQFVTEKFGDVRVYNDYLSPVSGYAKPRFLDFDNDTSVDLLVGAEDGKVYVFLQAVAGLNDSLEVAYDMGDFGSLSAPASATIDSTGKPVLIVGTERGGLLLHQFVPAVVVDTTDSTSTHLPPLEEKSFFNLYPNPTEGIANLEFNEPASRTIRVWNTVGQQVFEVRSQAQQVILSLEHLNAGMYIVEILEPHRRGLTKLLIGN
ncbi:T9SS type A sorting domain-containing protein [Pontibacter sp. G13]|uniref:T9SS type A sorting domain-containing protein n=1 Tax=Pontibacter sp. G13 TaxID=3074898 RepID=UPI00288AA6F3|nr:T9SS type A sorting domain-containing protein [Pontibacter sp. G13]WNJ15989.1 FG-GAP-like repeat-containing protein [Pontibacter sp. G13]